MCAVSVIGDHYIDKWGLGKPNTSEPLIWPNFIERDTPTKQEFEDLEKEVLDMKQLIKKAKKYDKESGQPDCEIEDKMDFFRKVAKLVGVDLDEVLL